MQSLPVDPGSIEIGERHRALDEEAVTRLQASMKDIGLKQPISIRIVDLMVIDGREVEGVPVLVAGRHRLEAARRLGWRHIDCVEVEDDALKAELWEIAENLHRCDLTKDQRDQHIRRYAEVLAEIEAATKIQVGQNDRPEIGYGKPPPQTKGPAAKIAEATGLSQRTVRRALNPRPAPPPLPDEDVEDIQFRSLMSAWNRAGPEARDRFLAEVMETQS